MSTSDPAGFDKDPYAQQPPYAGQPQPGTPYGTPQPGPEAGAPIPGAPQLAPLADRLVARLIDAAVLLIPTLLLAVILGTSFLYYALAALVAFGYEAAMLLTQGGQTVGKKVMKLRIVDVAQGGRPADNAYLIRAAVYGLPNAVYCVGSLFTLVNVLSPLWDKPLQQALHDKAASTVVVKES
ncbi:RDD family protein [Kitasatospora terrestris]|uniref:RDD domain-containing protein n=1 Tax=Kitasatospora terrestris TaxID=258051 RepID=A0ABP9D6N0_9ACTN